MRTYEVIQAGDNGLVAFIIIVIAIVVAEIIHNKKYYYRRLHKHFFCIRMNTKKEFTFWSTFFKHRKLIRDVVYIIRKKERI